MIFVDDLTGLQAVQRTKPPYTIKGKKRFNNTTIYFILIILYIIRHQLPETWFTINLFILLFLSRSKFTSIMTVDCCLPLIFSP